MFKTILAAVDGSGHGDLVAEKAGELAALSDARLLIAHIADPGAAHDDFDALATAEHVGMPQHGDLHPNIAQVPGWFDDALRSVEGAASVHEVLEKIGTQVLQRAAFVAKQDGATNVEMVLEHGNIASRLLEIANREGVDLIVLGSRGLGRIKEILLGSVSHKVAMMAHCPCLIVK